VSSLDLDSLFESFLSSMNTVLEYDILGISVFFWLIVFVVLFLVFDVLEKKLC
jgi:hypothetical protein